MALPRICVVAPCYNEEAGLAEFLQQLSALADSLPEYRWEFILVDDGSSDSTLDLLMARASQEPRLSVVALSRNFGHQAALAAGLARARGQAAICMDADLQHPPQLIPALLERWREGYDLVSAIRRDTQDASASKRWSSRLFYKLMNALSEVNLPEGSADFFLASRPVYRALRRCPERHRFLRGLVSWVGFRRGFVDYIAPARHAGESKYTLARMARLATDGAFAFSTAPIRLMSRLGVLVSSLGLGYFLYVLVRALVQRDVVPGWASILSTVLILGGLNLLFLGVLGEYLARVYEEAKGRPLYLVRRFHPSPTRPRRRRRASAPA